MKDQELIEGCKNNDRKSQRLLLDKYSGALMATAMRYSCDYHTAQDMIQETWIKAFKKLENYEEQGRLIGWLKKILINNILRNQEKKKITFSEIRPYEIDVKFVSLDNDHLEMEDLLRVIQSISSPSKEIFMMYVVDGFSHSEIASSLKIAASTSRVHLSNARKKLTEVLKRAERQTA